MRRLLSLFVLLLLAVFGTAQAQSGFFDLLIYNVWVRPTAAAPADGETPEPPLPGTVSSAYMTIENTSDEDYQLVGIETDFDEMTMIHETSIDDAGVARMRMVGRLDIPAGETVRLAPASYHAMLMNVTHDLFADTAETLVLNFADSSGATFDVTVGALVTDLPPEESTMIVANAVSEITDFSTLDVSLIIDNRTEQTGTLIAATSDFGHAEFQVPLSQRIAPAETLEIPAQTQTSVGSNGLIRFFDLPTTSIEAFPLTLTFESGKVITVPVPILAGDSE